MALFPIHHYRLFDDPFERFFGNQLDFFDPWYDTDLFLSFSSLRPNEFRWIHAPQQLPHSSNNNQGSHRTSKLSHGEKYRVQLNVAGFKPDTIKTKVEGQKVIVEAKHEQHQSDGDFNIHELRKSYEIPEHADPKHMVSYVTPHNILVIEMPINNPKREHRIAQVNNNDQILAQFGQHRDPLFDYVDFLSGSDFQPHIVDKDNNTKQLEMSIEMKNYKPEEIKVSIKNNQLIVQGERRHKDKNQAERSFFFKSTTLPPGTQIDQLQTRLTNDGQLKIEAPYLEQKKASQSIETHKK